jgi:hypothetical protein
MQDGRIPVRRGHSFAAGLMLMLAAGMACMIPSPALAGDSPTRIQRQIGVMDQLLDQVLVDSPNFLVSGKDAAEGFEVEDLGAIFTFRASVTGWGWNSGHTSGVFNFWPFQSQKQKVYVLRGDKGDGAAKEIVVDGGRIVVKDGEVYIDEDGKTRKLSEKDGVNVLDEKELQQDRLKKYEAAKEELIKFLLDYGETLRTLPAGQSVRIVARMEDLGLPEGREVHSLTLRASIDDLRAYGDGHMSESAARAKIVIKES